MIEKWVAEIKKNADFNELGMILVHNGMVRATAKDGRRAKSLELVCESIKSNCLVNGYKRREGIVAIKAWINKGLLNVGDDDVSLWLPESSTSFALIEELLSRLKKKRSFWKKNFINKARRYTWKINVTQEKWPR